MQQDAAQFELIKLVNRLLTNSGFTDSRIVQRPLHNYMDSIERGERNIAVLNLIRIAKALKVEVGELFPAAKSLNVD